MNGWFPRFNRRGDVASGSGSVWVKGQLVADPGWNPAWMTDDLVMFKGTGDRPYQQQVPPTGPPQQLSDEASTQYAAGAMNWKGNGYDAYGGRVIAVDVDPATGDLAELVEYGGDNNNHSLFLRGQPIVERQPISSPCLRDGLLVWTMWGSKRETWGYNGARVQPLTVFSGGEGRPVPVMVGSEPWVLVETNTDLRVHPWGSTYGYLSATGEDRNLNADVRYVRAVDQLQLVFNDSGGNIWRASFGLQEPRVDVSAGPMVSLPDEWPITQRTATEIFYPFHTCSGRESERALSPDGTGLLADYPQNVIGVGDSGAVPLATRVTLPIMLGGLAWAYHPNPEIAATGRQFGEAVKAAGLQRRVLTQWVAAADDNPVQGERGAPTAERVAQLEKARWKELFPELPSPPAMYYVGPQEVTAGDWFRPPSVGVYMPEFYFTPGTQSVTQIEREMWEKAELYIDKLGWDRPWIPVWQCYRRDWVKPTNMPLIAALQTMFFEGARQIEAELQKRMPAGEQRRVIYGNGLFAILRKEGAIEYPQAMAAHRRIFAAIPKGELPALRNAVVDPPPPPIDPIEEPPPFDPLEEPPMLPPKITISEPQFPLAGTAPFKVRCVYATEPGSGEVAFIEWWWRGAENVRFTVINPGSDTDHTFIFPTSGTYEVGAVGVNASGRHPTGQKREVIVTTVPVPSDPPAQPPTAGVTLKTATGHYLVIGPDKTLRADADEALASGFVIEKREERVTLTVDGKYLRAVNGSGPAIKADRDAPGPDELFALEPGENGNGVAFRTRTGTAFNAVNGGGGTLQAIPKAVILSHETFIPSKPLLSGGGGGQIPPASGDLTSWPRRGASLYALVTDGAWDYDRFSEQLRECGMNLTRVFALTANWAEQVNDIVWPFRKLPDGSWDLFDWNQKYFDRLERVVAAMNSQGVLVQLTLTELYGWSDRKRGLPGVPDAEQGPWRRNVNGIRWDSDRMFDVLPDDWLNQFIDRVVQTTKGAGVIYELGNEMPEKPFHFRLRDAVRRTWPEAAVTVNRQEDTPGQYANMGIGRDFDRLAYHGKRDVASLDETHDNGAATDRPDTIRKLINGWPGVDPARIIFSSDGCRASMDPVNTYDWPTLMEVIRYVVGKGCSYEHQSRSKITRILTGRADLDTLEVDFLRQIANL